MTGTPSLAEKGACPHTQDYVIRAWLVLIMVLWPANLELGVWVRKWFAVSSRELEPARSGSQGRTFNCHKFCVLVNITLVTWNWPWWDVQHLPLELQTLQIRAFSLKRRLEQDETALKVNIKTVVSGSWRGDGIYLFEWMNEHILDMPPTASPRIKISG